METHHMDAAVRQRKVVNRLRPASGQLAAVIAAVEAGKDCRDVVTRLTVVSSALDKAAGRSIVATAMRDCLVREEPSENRLTADELEKLSLTLA